MRCSHTPQRLKISVDDGLCVTQGGKVDLTALSLKSLSTKGKCFGYVCTTDKGNNVQYVVFIHLT